VTAAADSDRLRKRIVDLHARLGAADEPEAISARRLLLNCLNENGKEWTLATLSIADGFERLTKLPPDAPIFTTECPHCKRVFGSFAPLLSSADDVAALIAAHDQVADDDRTVSATARNQIKTILKRHDLNWNDLTNLLRHSMEDIDEWQPNLFDEMCDTFNEFVWWKHNEYLATTILWDLHTYFYDQFDHTPRLAVISEIFGSSKTVILKLIERTCRRPERADNITVPGLYCLINDKRPTVLLDEGDNLPWEDRNLIAVYNSGFQVGGKLRRFGKEYEVHAPLAFGFWLGSGARLPPATSMSRTIRIVADQAPQAILKKLTRFSERNLEVMAKLAALRQRIEEWVINGGVTLELDPPDMPVGLGRAADKWRVLIEIADALGRGDIAREAARFVSKHQHDDEDASLRALRCCRDVFDGKHVIDAKGKRVDRFKPQSLVDGLCELENENWSVFRGLPRKEQQEPHKLTKKELAVLLAPFGIYPRTVWPKGPRTKASKSFHGYMREWFEEKWKQYCSEDEPTPTQVSGIKHLRVVKS
jgi:hypothetical protein